MNKNKIISIIVNDYVFYMCLIAFVMISSLFIFKFKKISKNKKIILSLICIIAIIVLFFFAYISFQFGKDNRPEYIKRDLRLLSSNEVYIEKVELSNVFLIVEGKTLVNQKIEEIKFEEDNNKLYVMILSNRKASDNENFRYKIEGDFDRVRYVYLRSIEGGYGGLEDKLIYEH